MTTIRVMVLGATGFTGSMVVDGLLPRDEVASVVTPVRREADRQHPKLVQREVNFDRLDEYADLFEVDVIVCCLGTTIRKAGSQQVFRKVDYGYPLKAAELGRSRGTRAFVLMSAIASSSSSNVFYNRVKGELEDSVSGLGYPFLSIYRPSLLLGDREEHRTAEALGMKAMPLLNRAMIGPLEKYRGIEADTVARAMVNEVCGLSLTTDVKDVVRIHEYPDIVALAR
ncbi:NAD-dependent epimerase/dehydratase family protein [uncultured Marinobacter sp.]|uniref:NAD-dependent epimerase/dehydratase family protein n=1 Tax=uncultured Marinobacter sp. TaxID=187379 RepID=UPI002616773A|nr:NAD-dependent epimerase/dehydratase family protein [uncultured Marinobacter sp.]